MHLLFQWTTKMAPRAKSLKCGGCNNIIKNKSDKVLCVSCELFYHVECVKNMEIDLEQFSKLGKISGWKCDSCESDLEVMEVNESHSRIKTVSPAEGSNSCCHCFEHIKF